MITESTLRLDGNTIMKLEGEKWELTPARGNITLTLEGYSGNLFLGKGTSSQ